MMPSSTMPLRTNGATPRNDSPRVVDSSSELMTYTLRPIRWGDEADLDDNEGKDPEPDGNCFLRVPEIKPGHERKEDRHGKQDHGQAVHDTSEHQVNEEDGDENRQWGEAGVCECLPQTGRHLRQREEAVEDLCADEDEEDHPGRLRGLKQARRECCPTQPSGRDGDKRSRSGPDRRSFGRGEDPEVDAADDGHEDSLPPATSCARLRTRSRTESLGSSGPDPGSSRTLTAIATE